MFLKYSINVFKCCSLCFAFELRQLLCWSLLLGAASCVKDTAWPCVRNVLKSVKLPLPCLFQSKCNKSNIHYNLAQNILISSNKGLFLPDLCCWYWSMVESPTSAQTARHHSHIHQTGMYMGCCPAFGSPQEPWNTRKRKQSVMSSIDNFFHSIFLEWP